MDIRSTHPLPLTFLLALAGCGGPAATDAGGTDGGLTPSDVPVAEVDGGADDAGPVACATLPPSAPFDFLPATCMPRCSYETRMAFEACARTDRACITAALAADTTPNTFLIDEFGPYEVTCGTFLEAGQRCYDWQSYACANDSCPAEYRSFINCLSTGAACTPEGQALVDCTDASAEFIPCQDARVAECFAPAP